MKEEEEKPEDDDEEMVKECKYSLVIFPEGRQPKFKNGC